MGGGGTLPLVKGRWVKLVVEIDLDADTHSFYYDGQLLYQAIWTTSSFGTGYKEIGALDLYCNDSSPVYYDDLSLSPAQELTNVTGNGTMARNPNQNWYAYGEMVELTATPATGYHFVEWTGACTGSGACSVTMDDNKSVSATFAIDTYTLSYPAGTGGTLTGVTPQTVNYGWRRDGGRRQYAGHRLPLCGLERRLQPPTRAASPTSRRIRPSRPTLRSTPSP